MRFIVLWGVLAFSVNARAEGLTGKIYRAGQWVEAKLRNAAAAPDSTFGFVGAPLDLRAAALDFVRDNSQLLGLDTRTTLTELSVQPGRELETHRFRKTWRGLEVLGGETLVHFRHGTVAFASGDATPLTGISGSARVSAEDARRIAFASYRGAARAAGAPELKVLLLGTSRDRSARLAYAVTVEDRDGLSSDVHYVGADDAQELLVVSNVEPLASRTVLAAGGTEDDFDVITDNDPSRIDGTFKTLYSDSCRPGSAPGAPCADADPAVTASGLAAWTNSGLVYDYYSDVHGRNSVDGNGLAIRSIVNFAGSSFQNAAWFNDRRVMLYGLGTPGSKFNDFASPLDVVGHEITHGVTASTAALQYASESGALNESYSDVFGKLIAYRNGKASDWKLGRDLFRDGTSFVRDMENPVVGNVKDFKYRGQQCSRFNDFCGVHDNSGIPSKAAVEIGKRMGLERLGRIYYLTLTQLLRSSSDFHEARAQTEAACATLYGAGSCGAVGEAFAAVGIQ